MMVALQFNCTFDVVVEGFESFTYLCQHPDWKLFAGDRKALAANGWLVILLYESILEVTSSLRQKIIKL